MKPWQWVVIVVVVISGLVVGCLGISLGLTWQSIRLLQTGQFAQASSNATRALMFLQPARVITAEQLASLNAWHGGLGLIQIAPEWQTAALALSDQLAGEENNSAPLLPLFQLTATKVEYLDTQWQSSVLTKVFPYRSQQLHQLSQDFQAARPAIQQLLTGSHRIALMLQNTDEVRATGGFMGSFILVDLENGRLKQWQLYDIYEPDGQFTGFVPAPVGVDRYLSEGKGWRLPDSNWQPDFPQSAQTIIEFLAKGNITEVDYVATINLTLLKQILTITGPVHLPDQNLTITTENSSELLRSTRGEFFAGSQAKKTVLKSLFTQLTLLLPQLDSPQHQQLLQLLYESFASKDVQFFARDITTQTWLQNVNWSGSAFKAAHPSTTLVLGSVESNVGINKANSAVSRQTTLEQLTASRWLVKQSFLHDGSNTLPYVNYQRYLLPAAAKVLKVTVNNQPLTTWDQTMTELSSGLKVTEIGFLSVTPVAQTSFFEFEFELPWEPTQLSLFKQAGIPAAQLQLKTFHLDQVITLQKDVNLPL